MQSRTCQAATGIVNDSLPEAMLTQKNNPWGQLQLYNLYRLVLAGILLLVSLTSYLTQASSTIDLKLYNDVIALYTVLVILQNITSYAQWPDFTKQVFGYAITDILALLLIIYASGGVSYGIGILLVLPVIIPNIFRPGQFSLLLAAVAVILLMLIELNIQAQGRAHLNELSRTGVLAFFIMLSSALAANWANSTKKITVLARQQGLELVNMSQLNQSVLDQLQLGVIVLHKSNKINHLNKLAIEILGDPKNWNDQPLSLFAPELADSFVYWWKNDSPKVMSYDVNHQGATALRARFVQLGTKTSATTLIYLQDTHEEREQLQDMKLASLGQLTASIAHEIRNPLGAISHAAQLLSESDTLNKADERLTEIIVSNSYRTDVIIESILNLSRRKNPKREVIRLKLWLKEFYADFLVQNKLLENQLSLFIEPENLEVEFDPAHLHQIMWNLNRNAVKYAKEDQTQLSLLIQVGIPDHTRNIVLNVIDNGVGLDKQKQQRLFEPFYTTGKKGTGLGLFVSRELSQANGATLEHVDLASGNCFRLSFSNR